MPSSSSIYSFNGSRAVTAYKEQKWDQIFEIIDSYFTPFAGND